MIKVGTTPVIDFNVGGRGVAQIKISTTPVWPDGYYYALVFKSVSYSSGNSVSAYHGDSYATFECYYKKVRSSDDAVLETTTVTASPSAYAFTNVYDNLHFDYANYKGTAVPASSTTQVTLSYGAATPITATFSFGGNTSYDTASITPIVLDSSVVAAGGGQVTYTGGDVTISRAWTSGYSEQLSSGTAQFSNPAYNSSVSTVYGVITSYTKTATINSLANNQTGGQTYYSFTSDAYGDNGATVSVTVYQSTNGMHQTSSYAFWDPDNDEAYPQAGITIPASPAGYVKFEIARTTTTSWDSGYPSSTTGATIHHSDYTYSNDSVGTAQCITNIGWYDSLYVLQANYSANTGSGMRMSLIRCTANDQSFDMGLLVTQPGA